MTNRVLICDNIDDSAQKILQGVSTVDIQQKFDAEVLSQNIHLYDAILVRSQTKLTASIIENAERLKIIARAGVGVDNIDIAAATKKGIIVVNSPSGNTIAAAEHTLAMMFALSRQIPEADKSLKLAEWRRKDFMGVELYRKCLAIVGLGKIGSHVAKVANSMGMRVIGYDPYVSPERASKMGIELFNLEELFSQADYITLHVPKTPETRHMISDRSFGHMKDGVRIINCARGGLIDENALCEAIQSGKVGGAALDTFESEPLGKSPLQELGKKVILTPHLGASTEEAQINVAVDVAEQVKSVLQGEHAQNAINIPSMLPHIMKEVQPYFKLAEKLGLFISQWVKSPIRKVEISYLGEIAEKNTDPLKVAISRGLLLPILKESVNYVNAPMLAKERGLEMQETRQITSHDYANLLTLKVQCQEESYAVSGYVLGGCEERIVSIDGFPISCTPSGYLLVIPHPDVPGMVGEIGKILGEHHINISGIQLGRHEVKGPAVMVVNIDDVISDNLLQNIKSYEDFKLTRLIDLGA